MSQRQEINELRFQVTRTIFLQSNTRIARTSSVRYYLEPYYTQCSIECFHFLSFPILVAMNLGFLLTA